MTANPELINQVTRLGEQHKGAIMFLMRCVTEERRDIIGMADGRGYRGHGIWFIYRHRNNCDFDSAIDDMVNNASGIAAELEANGILIGDF